MMGFFRTPSSFAVAVDRSSVKTSLPVPNASSVCGVSDLPKKEKNKSE